MILITNIKQREVSK